MSSLELERDLRRFGKPITMFFHVVSVAARDYAFEISRYDPGGGLPERLEAAACAFDGTIHELISGGLFIYTTP